MAKSRSQRSSKKRGRSFSSSLYCMRGAWCCNCCTHLIKAWHSKKAFKKGWWKGTANFGLGFCNFFMPTVKGVIPSHFATNKRFPGLEKRPFFSKWRRIKSVFTNENLLTKNFKGCCGQWEPLVFELPFENDATFSAQIFWIARLHFSYQTSTVPNSATDLPHAQRQGIIKIAGNKGASKVMVPTV